MRVIGELKRMIKSFYMSNRYSNNVTRQIHSRSTKMKMNLNILQKDILRIISFAMDKTTLALQVKLW